MNLNTEILKLIGWDSGVFKRPINEIEQIQSKLCSALLDKPRIKTKSELIKEDEFKLPRSKAKYTSIGKQSGEFIRFSSKAEWYSEKEESLTFTILSSKSADFKYHQEHSGKYFNTENLKHIIGMCLVDFQEKLIKSFSSELEKLNEKIEFIAEQLKSERKDTLKRISIQAKDKEEFKKIWEQVWDDKVSYKLLGFNSIELESNYVENLSKLGFNFDKIEIKKLSDLSPDAARKIRKEARERAVKIAGEKFGFKNEK